MKKTAIILFLVLAIPALLTSCLFDEEDLFDKSASERIEAAKQEAKTVLESAENGWHVRYFPSPTQEFGGYNLFFKFSEGSVTVASEIESNPSTTETSLYSFGEDLGVTLNFDTKNSLINYFVHPKNPDNIGSTYKGMEGDYKFTVMETSAAMVVLRGIITGNYYILTPVSADTDWSEDLETYRNNAEDMSFNTYSFVVKDKTYSATLTNRRFAVKIDSETTVYAPFIYTKAGISFYMPDFVREIQIDPEATFYDFHEAILKSVGYANDQMTSFFICDDDWEKGKEVTLEEMDDNPEIDSWVMKDTTISVTPRTLRETFAASSVVES